MDTEAQGTQAELARLLGVSEAACSGWVKRGIIHPGETLGEQLRALFAHLRAQAAGRVEDEGITQQRRELLTAKRRMAEIDLAEREGALVSAAEVKAAIFRLTRIERDKMLGWSARLGPALAAETDPERVRALLDAEVEKILRALAGRAEVIGQRKDRADQ
ncbi:MAG: hypothetical protein Q8M07_27495 [Prosthecobacter sp.]|nr:hypothetical protein [Prosthecobacter sp.]